MPSLQCKNFSELKEKYQLNLSKYNFNTIIRTISSSDFCQKAREFWEKDDFENCYVTIMKFLSMLSYLQKEKQLDMVLKEKVGKDYYEAIVLAETVTNKLEELYKAKDGPLVEKAQKEELKEEETMTGIISCANFFSMVKGSEKANHFLIMDTRSESDFDESRIEPRKLPVDIINVPDKIIELGKSAKSIENNLPKESLMFWDRRKDYERIITLDLNGLPGGKAGILKNILLNYDNIKLNNNVHVLEKGIIGWNECYPWTLTKPYPKTSLTSPVPSIDWHKIDFNLDFGVDNDEGKPIFDRTKKPQLNPNQPSIPTVDRSGKAAALKTYALTELLKNKEQEMKDVLEMEKQRLQSERNLQEDLLKQREAQFDEERQNILIEKEEKFLQEIANLKTNALLKDEKIKELEEMIKGHALQKKSLEEMNIESNINKHEEEAKRVKKECDDLEIERMKQEARSKPKPNYSQRRPEINRSVKPKYDGTPIVGKTPGLTGLKNLGNTCYMNSILQCISNNPLLADYFTHQKYQNDLNKSHKTQGQVAEKVAWVVCALWSGQTMVYACTDFKKTVGAIKSEYKTCEQQDSHEFLTFLMDWLHNDLKKETNSANIKEKQSEMERAWETFIGKNHSFIASLFYGLQKSTVSCSRCNEQSATYEPFSNLSLNIPDGDKLHLSTCLELYLKTEPISGWRCPKCKDQRLAEKKTEFCKLPDVLVIHLKRFSFLDIHSKKKTTFVKFPLDELNLDSNDERRNYSLYGVSNHYGTMEGGHYTAYCKNPLFKKWFKFDDHEVTEMAPMEVVTNAAYILFYKAVF